MKRRSPHRAGNSHDLEFPSAPWAQPAAALRTRSPARRRRCWTVLAAAAATAALIVGASGPAAATDQGSWTWPCERTTDPPAKPTGVTAAVNPTEEEGNTWGENGILISWDAPDESDDVHEYSIYRGVLVAGISPASTEVTLQGTITNVRARNLDTGGWTEPANPPEDIMDPEEFLEVGVTYVYRAVATRWDNCGDFQSSEQSDPVTATYQAPQDHEDASDGDTDEDGEFVGGL